ncbi:MAG: Rieske 2Fe-2S domain-containing protein [Candidatus Marinimicrobia bacterium]|nr:Rieske 2Fe-2S domain-containing protein [Candidatus Neomarinimicrobiota bacterium]
MPEFTTVAQTSDVSENEPFCVDFNGKEVALFLQNGTYFAIDNECTHKGGPLCEGTVEANEVECPWHGAKFDFTTGEATAMPAIQGVQSYEVNVEDTNIQIKGE